MTPLGSQRKLCCATLRVNGVHTICALERGHKDTPHISPTGDLSWQEDSPVTSYGTTSFGIGGCPAGDFRVCIEEGYRLVVQPMRGCDPHRLADWVCRKLNAPDFQPCPGCDRPSLCAVIKSGTQPCVHPALSAKLEWVIARDTSSMATAGEQPFLPGGDRPRKEIFWTGDSWKSDVNFAVRCRDTEAAISIMMNRNHLTAWVGCYLARVAAKPEPRYEVVDRP